MLLCYQRSIVSAPAQPGMPARSEAVLLEINAQLRQQLEAQAKLAQSAAQELEYARLKILVLEERLRLEWIAKYGKHSETLSDLQLELLDLEPGVSGEEVAAESERAPVAPRHRLTRLKASRGASIPGARRCLRIWSGWSRSLPARRSNAPAPSATKRRRSSATSRPRCWTFVRPSTSSP
jgi:hypothetical protein